VLLGVARLNCTSTIRGFGSAANCRKNSISCLSIPSGSSLSLITVDTEPRVLRVDAAAGEDGAPA
jgi:hypothetical protein